MTRVIRLFAALMITATVVTGCRSEEKKFAETMRANVAKYEEVVLTADLSWLSVDEREIISILIDASTVINEIFWKQSYGWIVDLMLTVADDNARKYAEINYGPWDRLNNNEAFVEGYERKPPGARFYPEDMSIEEFEAWDDPQKNSPYTIIRRDDNGKLISIPYSEEWKEEHIMVSDLMRRAARLATDEGLRRYLVMRAEALLTNEYQPSDFAWMEMKESNIDFIVGPIETYEDQLFGIKTAYEAFVLVKDPVWSAQLDKFNAMLPELQAGLPVPAEYKREVPASGSDINVYYALYYAGDCNAGPKTIAINLPNDPEVKLKAGDRKLQLKNAMQAKFEKILVPIANMLIDESQRKHITFDAFFENTTFHEVAHGLGVMNTVNGKGSVRDALLDQYSTIEEAKADIMGLYLVTKLYEAGEITSGDLMDNYVTFFAGIFRSSRFGAGSAHGMANMMNMNYFAQAGAFEYQKNGTYRVNFEEMKSAVESLLEKLLVIQGDGNIEEAREWIERDGVMSTSLRRDLDRVNASGIPVDIVFSQGKEVLGLRRERPRGNR